MPLHASTTLTFATVGGTGVSGTSGGPVLAMNPNDSKMLATGVTGSYVATPTYGSNVTTASADNGAFVVNGPATPDIGLAWTSSGTPPGTNIIEGISKGVAGWGSDPSNLSNNGVGQINSQAANSSISVTFTPAAGKGVFLESLDFYKSNLNTTPAASNGRGWRITVTGNGTPATSYTGTFAQNSAVEAINTFNFDGGVAGKPGEILTLTITRPIAADELAIVQAKLGSAFTVYTVAVNQHGIDNLRFSQFADTEYVVDSDGDGLSDFLETYSARTNPALKDTDGDGLSDGAEVYSALTNPLVSNASAVYYLRSRAGGAPVAVRNATTGMLTFKIGLSESPDLNTWTPLPLDAAGLEVAPTATGLSVGIQASQLTSHFYRFVTPQP